jgi:hypothetical protein
LSISKCCVFLLFLFSSAYGGKSAHLHYLPNVPVHLTSELKLDISQSHPGLSLSTKGAQNIRADLTIINDQPELPLASPPFSLKFLLKGIDIDLQANDENIAFRSEEMGTSLYLNQLSKLVDRPIHLRFGEGFKLSQHHEELSRAAVELPVLTEISPDQMLVEMFLHLFATAGQKLQVGQVIEQDLAEWTIPSLPQKVIYTITDIDDYNVHAEIKGDIEKRKFELGGQISLGEEAQAVAASLSGQLLGKVKWNRDNAMLYELSLDYSYVARFQLAQWEWQMFVSLNLHNKSKL